MACHGNGCIGAPTYYVVDEAREAVRRRTAELEAAIQRGDNQTAIDTRTEIIQNIEAQIKRLEAKVEG